MSPRKKSEEPQSAPGDKKKALEIAMGAINKKHGDNSIMAGLKGNAIQNVEFISSQSVGINRALGGGYAKGRIVEIYGPESSGKTTLTLHAIAEVQKTGGVAAFVDAEHALDPAYASAVGVNMDELVLSQPDSGEEALDIVETLTGSKAVDLIVVDSVAALVPQKELEGDMGDAQMGIQARLMSQACRKLTAKAFHNGVTIIFINQLRMKIGVMFGNPETTTGGNALKFYASQRIDVRRTGGVKDGDQLTGNQTRVKIVKNKVAPPFKTHEFVIEYGKGIEPYDDLIKVASEVGVIDKAGSWYSYEDARIGQGSKQVTEYLKNNPEVYEEVFSKVMDRI